MYLTEIHIQGFGVLNELSLADFGRGLNVIHGVNGSGKTTILHFLRGVFCGFADARRLRLLPPLKGGTPGGSIGVQYRDAHYRAIRHVRPDQLDSLAINLTHGRTSDVPQLRSELQTIDRDRFFTLFAVGNYESQAIDSLVRLAQRDGISLKNSTRQATWLTERIDKAKREREDLFQGSPSRGRIEELERRKAEIDAQGQSISQAKEAEHDRWATSVRQLQEQLERLQHEANWLHGELQLVQAELTEVHDRLWSRRMEIVREERLVQRAGPERTPAWMTELHEIDSQIAHSQQVLKDLAESRRLVSVQSAGLAGVETPAIETYFARHRQAVGQLEQQAQRLASLEQSLHQAQMGQRCICQQTQSEIRVALESIRHQIYFICQELSRQQSVHQQVLLMTQRENIDSCELEVIRQIQRLRGRRDELLHHAQRSESDRIQHRTLHDAAHCECTSHGAYVRQLPLQVEKGAPIVEQLVTEHTREVSNARPGDADRARALQSRRRQLEQQWWDAQQKWCDAHQRLQRLLSQPEQFSEDKQLQQQRYEFAVVEQQLADAREQWQSLALLQQVLKRTQEHLQVEQPSAVIEEASRLLERLTEGRYPRFHFDAAGDQLLVQNDSGERLVMHALSRGTLDQASLAFRLALWSEYLRRGISLPLLLDDVLNDSDEDRLKVAVDILAEYGQKLQIFFFTCQEHLANLFESRDVQVRDLPGSTRTRTISTELARWSAPVQATEAVAQESQLISEAADEDAEDEPYDYLQRTQPDEPYWLQADSPLMNVPSLSAQMARRLGALGVRHVADLIDLDPEAGDIPLDSLQISAATLRNWQAECRLLCCVPELTNRDAQTLVAVGIMSPAELAEAGADDLSLRVDRLRRGPGEHMALTWLTQDAHWPSQDLISSWIRLGHRARSFRAAREWAASRRGYRSRRDRMGQVSPRSTHSHSSREDRPAREKLRVTTAAQDATSVAAPAPQLAVSHATASQQANSRQYRFFLNLDSPVVDAPSIGPRMSERLEKIGVVLVSDLLNRDAAGMASKLNLNRVSTETVQEWQHQARLMTAVPEMRGHDVQVLVALGITSPEQLARYTPQDLFAIVGPFVESRDGQRLLRSSKTPDLAEVTEWIEYASHSRSLKAA